jgi:hypothetical protein
MRGVAAAGFALSFMCVAALWAAGGGTAVAYAIFCAVVVIPGIPLGIALFGRRHPAAWISGALIGYGLAQILVWLVIESRFQSVWVFAVLWLVLFGVSWALLRRTGPHPVVRLPDWTAPDSRALLLVLMLVPVLMGPPYTNLGRADANGTRYYRAYFTADFLWHSALAFELGRFTLPPRNPYLAPRVMNYYWTYFLLPSSTARLTGSPTPDVVTVQSILKANAMLAGLLMVGALFLVARTGVPRPGAAALAVTLAVVAASAEGLYAIIDLISRGQPLSVLLDTNIDAITAWYFDGMRIDNVPRSLWYTPQHTTAVALGLIGWLIALGSGARASLSAILAAGLALGLATTMNPFLGACFALVYGATMAVDALFVAGDWRLIVRHALAAGPVAAAVAWTFLCRMTEGAGSAIDVGLPEMSQSGAAASVLLGLGPVLLPALAGLRKRPGQWHLPVIAATTGLALGLFLLYFVRISEGSWVGFRAGQVMLVCIPVLLARTFSSLGRGSSALLATAILVLGLPTTAIDTWNASDISNKREGPGFRWTLWTTRDQQQAFAWIRAQTPADAIVQMEPMVRGREHWTLIPSFAGRRMAAGLPISLLPQPEYTETSERIRSIYQGANAEDASDTARRLRIDYLYVDATDTAAYPDGVRKFDEHPALFSRVFSSGDARVYRVH